MGGTSGANHLKVQVGTYRNKPKFAPLCHPEERGYMWDRTVFDRMVKDGSMTACTACIRTLERDEALLALIDANAELNELRGQLLTLTTEGNNT